MKLGIAVPVLAVCALVAATCARTPSSSDQRLEVGDIAPAYVLPTLAGDQDVNFGRWFQENTATVVIVWSMSCPTCREALVECERVHRLYADRAVRFVGVNYDSENLVGVRAFLKAEGVTFPNVWDARKRVARAYRALDYTFSIFVVDRDRTLTLVQYDHPPDLGAILVKTIDKMTAEEIKGR
ncbi:MAG: TlpA disulfide reductase family protein [bacterium]